VNEQLLENPTLEVVADTEGGPSEQEIKLQEKATASADDVVEQQNGASGEGIDWERYLQQMAEGGNSGPKDLGGTIHDELPPIETNLTYGESLADHLSWQLHTMRMNEAELQAALAIVHNLDHRGYLALPLEEIIELEGLDPQVARDALEIVQELDPLGCGAA